MVELKNVSAGNRQGFRWGEREEEGVKEDLGEVWSNVTAVVESGTSDRLASDLATPCSKSM